MQLVNPSEEVVVASTAAQLDVPSPNEDQLSVCLSVNSRKDSGIRSNSRRSSIQQQVSFHCSHAIVLILIYVSPCFYSHFVLLLVTVLQVLLPMSAPIFTIISFPFCIFIIFFHLSLSVPILLLHLILHLRLLIFIFTFFCFAFFIHFLSFPPPHY